MPIQYDRKNQRWRFSFNRVIANQRHRATKLLPEGWSRAQADAFDREETARLYAIASGAEKPKASIEDAVEVYCRERVPQLKHGGNQIKELALIYWAYQGKTIDQLADVAAEYAAKEAGRIAPATIRNRLAYLRAACRYAFRFHKMGDHDPSERMRMPVVRNERHVYASREQMLKIAMKCKRRDVRAVIRIAFYSGMRRSEIMRAEVSEGVFLLADTKNSDRRMVPIHQKIRTCLKYLPLSITKATIRKHFVIAREDAGLPGVNFHDLRHSAASEMINSGVDLYTVGAVLGHRDPRSTKRYAHLATQTLAKAVGLIGQKNAHHKKKRAA